MNPDKRLIAFLVFLSLTSLSAPHVANAQSTVPAPPSSAPPAAQPGSGGAASPGDATPPPGSPPTTPSGKSPLPSGPFYGGPSGSPVQVYPANAPGFPAGPVELPANTPVGHVVERRPGEVVIDIGLNADVKPGAHVEFFVERNIGLGAGERAQSYEGTAVGQVLAASATRAQVRLGVNERVPLGALARRTLRDLTRSRVAPPRLEDIWEAKFMARPFLTLETVGIGAAFDLSLAYRFRAPVSVRLAGDPLAFAVVKGRDVFAGSGTAFVAFDHRYFEIGLGVGVTTVNALTNGRTGSALSIAQTVRLGAVDGAHLHVQNSFIVFDDEYHYGGTTVSAQLSVMDGVWLLIRGGGSVAGYGFGEVGLRVLMQGNGDRGSLFLTPTLGGAVVFRDEPYNSQTYSSGVSYGGPLIGLGAEFRL